MSEDLEAVQLIATMADLGRELRRRRIAAGFTTLPELLKNVKRDYPLPRSTAYTLEEGLRKCNWISIEAHLRACGAQNSEISVWQEAHRRALSNYGDQTPINSGKASAVPTAKQLAEMGPELAARTLSEIDLAKAADLLRRIELKQAVELLPEISLNVVVSLLVEVGQARATLLFENINVARGAELLAEMSSEDTLRSLDDLDTSRAAELIAAMPRGLAAKVLRDIAADRALRMLTEMPPAQAAKLLGELDFDFVASLANSGRASKVARVLERMDSELMAELLVNSTTDEKALKLLERMEAQAAVRCLSNMESGVARRFVTQMSAERIGQLIGEFTSKWQAEILSNILDVAQAAQALMCADYESIRYILNDIPPEQLAAIMMEMNAHERVLNLALMRNFREPVLTKLPDEVAAELRQEVELPNLAKHLGETDPERAYMYLGEMKEIRGELISMMNSDAAARIVESIGYFDGMADLLDAVEPRRTGWILQTMAPWEAAAIVELMQPDHTVAALAEADSAFIEVVLYKLDEDADKRRFKDEYLSRDEFEKLRIKRTKAASYIRKQLTEMREKQRTPRSRGSTEA